MTKLPTLGLPMADAFLAELARLHEPQGLTYVNLVVEAYLLRIEIAKESDNRKQKAMINTAAAQMATRSVAYDGVLDVNQVFSDGEGLRQLGLADLISQRLKKQEQQSG